MTPFGSTAFTFLGTSSGPLKVPRLSLTGAMVVGVAAGGVSANVTVSGGALVMGPAASVAVLSGASFSCAASVGSQLAGVLNFTAQSSGAVSGSVSLDPTLVVTGGGSVVVSALAVPAGTDLWFNASAAAAAPLVSCAVATGGCISGAGNVHLSGVTFGTSVFGVAATGLSICTYSLFAVCCCAMSLAQDAAPHSFASIPSFPHALC